jgi:hypothetical protein
MARHLSAKMNDIVSKARALSSRRELHDKFMYVRNTACRLHHSKTPSLLIKLDIAKAFDTVHGDYMLDLLQHLGFPQRWRALLMTLFSTASSRIILNGIPGKNILHGCNLRQGDPLSPLLFDNAIDPLQRLLEKAADSGLLSAIPGGIQGHRVSLYADGAAIILSPTMHDVEGLVSILQNFGEVCGLVTNATKSSISPIQCANINLEEILTNFPATMTPFPIKYPGLPLSLGRLRRVDLQPYIHKAVARLNPWKGKFLNRDGCMALVKSVLSSMPIFLLTALNANKIARGQVIYLGKGIGSAVRLHSARGWNRIFLS